MAAVVDFGAPASAQLSQPRGRGFSERRRAVSPPARPAGVAQPPIDHEHLARYTLGSSELEREVLELFVGEAPRTLAAMRAAAACEPVAAKAWHMGGHTLKGSARAVGAWRVAAAAEAAERDHQGEPAALQAHISALEAAVGEVVAYLGGLYGAAPPTG
jgi:HPt (histidine-containing phosphotransfer) domain-containing protein